MVSAHCRPGGTASSLIWIKAGRPGLRLNAQKPGRGRDPSPDPAQRRVGKAVKKLLLPVDGSLDSLAAVWHVIREAQSGPAFEVHLLNVQQRSVEESMIAVPVEDPETFYRRRSIKALECAERSLNDAGIDCVTHRTVGPVAESIVEKQRELGCEAIVLSTQGRGRDEPAPGSVASRVLALAPVPVTVVKAHDPAGAQ